MRYEAPQSLDAAVSLLAGAPGQARLLAGGTDLLVQLRAGLIEPELVVDIKKIPEMHEITAENGGFRIGAAVTGAELGEHPEVKRLWPGVVEAVELIGSTQIQGRATMVGNLCNASPAADSVPALIAAGAIATVVGPGGRREVPVEEICIAPGKTSLAQGEIVTSVFLPARAARSGDAYLRFIPRTEMDIAVVGAGVCLTLDRDGTCTAARVGLGAVAARPLLVTEAGEALIGTTLDKAALERLAAAASAACRPIDDKRGTKEYRIKVAGVLARRAAEIALARARAALMAKLHVTTTVNGDPVEFLCEPEQTLLDVLRDELELTGSKEGCASGDCGACSVMLDGRLVCACLVLGAEAEGRSVETIEGMARGDRAAPLAAEVPRARGAAVRRLHAGLPGRRQGAARPEPGPERDRGALLARRQPLPLHRLRQDRPRRARHRR